MIIDNRNEYERYSGAINDIFSTLHSRNGNHMSYMPIVGKHHVSNRLITVLLDMGIINRIKRGVYKWVDMEQRPSSELVLGVLDAMNASDRKRCLEAAEDKEERATVGALLHSGEIDKVVFTEEEREMMRELEREYEESFSDVPATLMRMSDQMAKLDHKLLCLLDMWE